MKIFDEGLCSIQEYNQFKARIFNAVDEWIKYCDSDPEMGIAIEQATLDVEIMSKREYYETCFNNAELSHDCSCAELCNKEEAKAHEWIPLETFATDGEANADAVLNLADQFCFVR